MVFPSIPICLDPPSWNQQQAVQVPQEAAQLLHPGGGNMSTSVARPVSTAERARLAKIPQPEPALKCPRCDSTNTKFCYYNNYSLTQPRHFCKTCRRYWTRGGALRNVPVGGGCRRNKRAKSSAGAASSSKLPATAPESSTPTTRAGTVGGGHQLQQLPFMGSLHPLPEYVNPNLGLNFGRMQPVGTEGGTVGLGSSRLQQQIQQFPFLSGLEGAQGAPVAGLYSMIGAGAGAGGSVSEQVQMKSSSSGVVNTELSSVQMENSSQTINFPRQYGLSFPQNTDNFWISGVGRHSGTNAAGSGQWPTDLSAFNSSTGSLL